MADGASANEQLLAAARADNEEMLLQIFNGTAVYDINHQDGMGNTALHYAAAYGSTDVLDPILEHEGCDVDLINNVGRETPLHLALQLDDHEVRRFIVRNLLEAGADMTIADKHGSTARDLIPTDDPEIRDLFQQAEVQTSIGDDDIASDDDIVVGDEQDEYSDQE